MALGGTRWYLGLLGGTRWYLGVLFGTWWYLVLARLAAGQVW